MARFRRRVDVQNLLFSVLKFFSYHCTDEERRFLASSHKCGIRHLSQNVFDEYQLKSSGKWHILADVVTCNARSYLFLDYYSRHWTDKERMFLADSYKRGIGYLSQNMFHLYQDTEVIKQCGPARL